MGKDRYGIVLDAGSSGTRIYIYKWDRPEHARKEADPKALGRLPELKWEKEWVKKIKPGIATYGDNPEQVGPEYLRELLEHAHTIIPEDELSSTPVFLLATAGMRLLEDGKRKQLLAEICSYAQQNTKFQLPDCDLHVQVIPGETEGLYGWLATNYLLGGFDKPEDHDHGKNHHTYGFLDMGGASAQIAFAPNATEAEKHANDLKLLRLRNIDGTSVEHKVFTTTWLGFGVNEARRRYVDSLLESMPDTERLPDPCLPAGLTVTTSGTPIKPGSPEDKGEKTHIEGTGKFETCLKSVYPLLDKDAPCEDPPCLLHGSHVPAIDFDVNHFIGVSEYWHTTHEIFEFAHKDKSYDLHTYQKRVKEFCSMDWETLQKGVKKHKWGHKVDEQKVQEVCFKASWLINVLHDGIGVPRIGHEDMGSEINGTKEVLDKAGYLDYFQAVNKIDKKEVSWTLGKMVLYASSEIPPADANVLEVGFGTNEPGKGISSDFQYAGGSPISWHLDGDNDDWHDVLLKDTPRRIPGIIIFILILLIALFILCGRDRRKTMLRRVRRVFPSRSTKKRRGGGLGNGVIKPLNLALASKLFGGSHHAAGPAYERVLEEGTGPGGAYYDDFELPEINTPHGDPYADEQDHSDSSDGSARVGRTSGWATPQIMGPPTGKSTFEGQMGAYFDHAPTVGGGSGPPSVVGNAIARGGLMARVDSRERLTIDPEKSRAKSRNRDGVGVGRSRANSPSKLRSFKESVD